jgi:predicted GNAT superfamily acetyltransferase
LGQRPVAIEIPDNINLLLKNNVELAISWRAATRQAFTRAMAASYVVEEFYRLTRDGQNVGVYLLSVKK